MPCRQASKNMLGLCPRFGLWPTNLRQSPNRGHSQRLGGRYRQGIALPHIGRRSRGEERVQMIFCAQQVALIKLKNVLGQGGG